MISVHEQIDGGTYDRLSMSLCPQLEQSVLSRLDEEMFRLSHDLREVIDPIDRTILPEDT